MSNKENGSPKEVLLTHIRQGQTGQVKTIVKRFSQNEVLSMCKQLFVTPESVNDAQPLYETVLDAALKTGYYHLFSRGKAGSLR